MRALVGGSDYRARPFNLATQGQRQPGSTVKPFILAAALRRGLGIGSVWESRKREFDVPIGGGSEKFVVNNFEDSYAGAAHARLRADGVRQRRLRGGRPEGRDAPDLAADRAHGRAHAGLDELRR